MYEADSSRPAAIRRLVAAWIINPFPLSEVFLYRHLSQDRSVLLKKTALFALWGIAVGFGIYHHTVWRDEVRALSIALEGDNVIEMFRAGQGEAHPFVWHIILRTAHAIYPSPLILPAMAALVASAAVGLLIYCSPFSLGFLAIFLLGKASLYEYAVMARNYGISMLLMFLFACCYKAKRDRGVALGVILAILANCNVHSAMLAGAYLIFWGGDILIESSFKATKEFRNFLVNSVIVVIGIIIAFLSVYPTVNDAAILDHSQTPLVYSIFKAVLLPTKLLSPRDWLAYHLEQHSAVLIVANIAFAVFLFACPLGLIWRPSAALAAIISLWGFSLFFALIYPAWYRHTQLWLVFLTTLYWMNRAPAQEQKPWVMTTVPWLNLKPLSHLGTACFLIYVFFQVPIGVQTIRASISGVPQSQSSHFADLIKSTPAYHDAIIIADPDYLVEPMPYYVPNQTYIIREHRWGRMSYFKKDVRQSLTLRDILNTAVSLHNETNRPVLIALAQPIAPSMQEQDIPESYILKLHVTSSDATYFLQNTTIVQKRIMTETDESYDVYALNMSSSAE